ncbi:Crp/Fnr family transcriptional regulator [Chitinophaga sp. 22321]|uniref:Crp/Fnr family transcriptional regulator n=1 Tax=Chitinophaga hostae TaxID=2831022 RepID=A0ABS5J9M7_9BACT|nr:Crp/Fnr family transcriptional regulator [Chitinophaga hostae]MBS0031912.1 Crp/Fnr family transcriptional regulator [Chitinophaga hostae]
MYDQLTTFILSKINVTDAQLSAILSHFKSLKTTRHQLLLTEGELSKNIFFVSSGCVRVYFIDENGQEATRYLAFENNFVSGLMSFISQRPSHEFIQAVMPSQLLAISRNDFYYLLDTIPAWEKFYRHYLENAYVVNTSRLMSFITQTAGERYRQLLLEAPHIVQRLPNKLVASYLNISQETLSRLKSKR